MKDQLKQLLAAFLAGAALALLVASILELRNWI